MLEASFHAIPFSVNPAPAGCWQDNLEVQLVAQRVVPQAVLLVVVLVYRLYPAWWEIQAGIPTVFELCFVCSQLLSVLLMQGRLCSANTDSSTEILELTISHIRPQLLLTCESFAT